MPPATKLRNMPRISPRRDSAKNATERNTESSNTYGIRIAAIFMNADIHIHPAKFTSADRAKQINDETTLSLT